MRKIDFLDLQTQYQQIKPEIQAAINGVLDNCSYIMGPEVAAFEKSFAAFCRVKRAVGVANGTDALFLTLKAFGIGADDYVITVPNTFIATSEVVTTAGGKIAFSDIDAATMLMCPVKLEATIKDLRHQGKRVKAIIPVHLYGQPCDMPRIMEVAKKYDLRVLEDAAQAHGAEFNGTRVGNFGDAATFSFYPGKNLGAYGDAGAIVTNDAAIGERVAMLRNHGRKEKYLHEMEGYSSRLDSLQAAILSVKLKHLETWTEQRRQWTSLYMEELANVPGLTLPSIPKAARHVFHLFVVRVKDRDGLQKKLKEKGVASGVHYPTPLHLQPAYEHLGLREGTFPASEESCKTILSLPLDPNFTADDIKYVSNAVRESLR